MTLEEAQEKFQEMMGIFEELKVEVRKRSSHVFENWKAGGFALDDTFFSNYYNLEHAIELVFDEEEEEQ